jgi:hypothetical protein
LSTSQAAVACCIRGRVVAIGGFLLEHENSRPLGDGWTHRLVMEPRLWRKGG